MLHIASRVFFTILVPLYGGYVGAPTINLLIYVLVAAAWSLWAYGQPGPKTLWKMGGLIGVAKGWLIMAVVVLIGAAPAFAVGYFIARMSN
jgi:hypothetical protein